MVDDDSDIDFVDDDDSVWENEDEEEIDNNYKKGDYVFAWYCDEKNNLDTATSWWPAKIVDKEKLHFFYELI